MNYEEGLQHMLKLNETIKEKNLKTKFQVGDLTIEYPGYKKAGDYRLSKNGVAPSHEQIVNANYKLTTPDNFTKITAALDGLYTNECYIVNLDYRIYFAYQ